MCIYKILNKKIIELYLFSFKLKCFYFLKIWYFLVSIKQNFKDSEEKTQHILFKEKKSYFYSFCVKSIVIIATWKFPSSAWWG